MPNVCKIKRKSYPSYIATVTEMCNHCTNLFTYKKKDIIRRQYPFTCNHCIRTKCNLYPDNERKLLTTYKHGHSGRRVKTKSYRLWSSMKERCYNKNSKTYKFYGAKGINVCDKWLNNYEKFLNDITIIGYREGYSVLRINKKGNYEPSNIKINFSKGTAKLHYYRGNHYTLAQLFKYATNKIQLRGLQKRLILGYTIEDALHKPLRETKVTQQRIKQWEIPDKQELIQKTL